VGARLRRGRWLVPSAALVAALITVLVAEGHGREVNIGVSCVALDPARPLSKVCTAVVAYLDGDPVADAKLSLTASREDGARRAFGPVAFQPGGEAGVYTAAFDYPAYGKWLATVRVAEPGEGGADLREEVLPPLPGAINSSATNAARVRIVLDLDAREVTSVVVRGVHLFAAMAWFALSALVLAASLALSGSQRERHMRSLARIFPWAAGGSLLAVALTGWYNATYNAPTRPPGLFDPASIGRLSFGEAYLFAFLVKMVLSAAILAVSVGLAVALRRAYTPALPPRIAGGAAHALAARGVERLVVGLSVVNIVMGLLVFAVVVVIGYLHILTHIGGLYGPA
jgi:hypothetical protein